MAKQRHDAGLRKRMKAAGARAKQAPDTEAMARVLVRAGKCSKAILGHSIRPTDKES